MAALCDIEISKAEISDEEKAKWGKKELYAYTTGEREWSYGKKFGRTKHIYAGGAPEYKKLTIHFGDLSKEQFDRLGDDVKSNVRIIEIEGSVRMPQDCSHLFEGFRSLREIRGVESLKVKDVTDMSYMFSGCRKLVILNLSAWNTGNVRDMSHMFEGCSELVSLTLGRMNTSNIENMSCMFYGCSSLTRTDVKYFDTSNVTDMSSMFAYCNAAQKLDVGHFVTSNVCDMSYMFSNCTSASSLSVAQFDVSSVRSMQGMFNNCKVLDALELGAWDVRHVDNVRQMFMRCPAGKLWKPIIEAGGLPAVRSMEEARKEMTDSPAIRAARDGGQRQMSQGPVQAKGR